MRAQYVRLQMNEGDNCAVGFNFCWARHGFAAKSYSYFRLARAAKRPVCY